MEDEGDKQRKAKFAGFVIQTRLVSSSRALVSSDHLISCVNLLGWCYGSVCDLCYDCVEAALASDTQSSDVVGSDILR